MPHKHGGKYPSREKAEEMLRHGKVRGKKITPAQHGLFGLLAGGGTPSRVRNQGGSHERRAAAKRKARGG